MQAENWVWTLKILIHFLHGQRTTQTMHFYCLNLTNILSIWKAQVKYHRVLLEIWCRFFNSKSNRCWKQSIDSYLLARILCKSRNYFWSLKLKVHGDGLVGDFMMVTNFNIRHQHQCSRRIENLLDTTLLWRWIDSSWVKIFSPETKNTKKAMVFNFIFDVRKIWSIKIDIKLIHSYIINLF